MLWDQPPTLQLPPLILQPKISFKVFPQREMSPPKVAQRVGSLTRLRSLHTPLSSPSTNSQSHSPHQPPPQWNPNASGNVISHPDRRRCLLFSTLHWRQQHQPISLTPLQNHEHSVPKFGHQKRDSAPRPSAPSPKVDSECSFRCV